LFIWKTFLFSRAERHVRKYFTEHYLSEQNILQDSKQRELMLKLLPEEAGKFCKS